MEVTFVYIQQLADKSELGLKRSKTLADDPFSVVPC
jgi:hypothetical protein